MIANFTSYFIIICIAVLRFLYFPTCFDSIRNIYGEAFLEKLLKAKSNSRFGKNNSISDVWLGSKYAFDYEEFHGAIPQNLKSTKVRNSGFLYHGFNINVNMKIKSNFYRVIRGFWKSCTRNIFGKYYTKARWK